MRSHLDTSRTLALVLLVALGLAVGSVPREASPQVNEGAAAAAKSFAAGQYVEAARRYQVLVATHGPSADLLFNLGTARAEAGEHGQAIFALEQARLLAPRDTGIRQNLDIVRQRVRVARMEESGRRELTEGEPDAVFWFRLATWFVPVELAWIVVIFNFLTFGALAVRRQLRAGALRDTATVVAFGAMTALALSLSMLFAHAAIVKQVQIGVVLNEEVELHQTPTATALTRPHPDVYSGAVLRVLDRRSDGWTQVRVVDDTVGWLRSAEIGALD
jgi:tetratricopeptide (TPR) repeat protein